MCYAHPGPRCSAHAAQILTRAQIECNQVVFKQFDSDEEKYKEYDRLIAKRTRAEKEFDATPAGMAILKQKIKHETGHTREQAKDKLAQAKALRAHRLSLIKAKDRGDIGVHSDARLSTLYQRLGLREDFDTTSADRIGWDTSTEQFKQSTTLLVKASDAWMKNMTPEQIAAVQWVTGRGSEVLSRHGNGHDPGYFGRQYSAEEIERRARLVEEAFDKAPRMPKPVVLYRGIGSQFPFDADKVIADGEYTAPSVLSATINPGVANSFGYKNVIMEIKTRRFASPTNFSGAGPREAEVMIKPGSRFKVTGVLRDVTFGWREENKVPGYTVIQVEEIED